MPDASMNKYRVTRMSRWNYTVEIKICGPSWGYEYGLWHDLCHRLTLHGAKRAIRRDKTKRALVGVVFKDDPGLDLRESDLAMP